MNRMLCAAGGGEHGLPRINAITFVREIAYLYSIVATQSFSRYQ
jgi:hypothetical protein